MRILTIFSLSIFFLSQAVAQEGIEKMSKEKKEQTIDVSPLFKSLWERADSTGAEKKDPWSVSAKAEKWDLCNPPVLTVRSVDFDNCQRAEEMVKKVKEADPDSEFPLLHLMAETFLYAKSCIVCKNADKKSDITDAEAQELRSHATLLSLVYRQNLNLLRDKFKVDVPSFNNILPCGTLF